MLNRPVVLLRRSRTATAPNRAEAPLKDQKIALLEQRISNMGKENDLLKQQNAIQEKLTERGRGWQAKIELGAPADIVASRFCLRVFGREIRMKLRSSHKN